ncbi:hypothetical protein PtrV1_10083 [Pyrenophora tritici-repentis]|nr:hypothetical protein PtrV1_10083 [Pyrenophora tritici-repentis]KAF7446075.1 hypothetical protein A1F99_093660 [Pyrenophora tritici-repentis]
MHDVKHFFATVRMTVRDIRNRIFYPRKVRYLANGLMDATPLSPTEIALTHRNALTSPLLRLPPELRNKIYTYVIYDCLAYITSGQPTASLNLQLVCRNTYKESRLLTFSLNHFWYYSCPFPRGLNTDIAVLRKRLLPVQLRAIEIVVVDSMMMRNRLRWMYFRGVEFELGFLKGLG